MGELANAWEKFQAILKRQDDAGAVERARLQPQVDEAWLAVGKALESPAGNDDAADAEARRAIAEYDRGGKGKPVISVPIQPKIVPAVKGSLGKAGSGTDKGSLGS